MKPVVILPVCKPDLHLALKWITWAKWLYESDNGAAYQLVIFAAKSVEEALLERLCFAAGTSSRIRLAQNPEFYERHDLGYAACANHMFRAGLEYTEAHFPNHPTLWCEPDCIPCHARWYDDIADEYTLYQRPVLGDFHAPSVVPHVSGNAVYPADWRKLIPSFALLPGPIPEQGWDSQCAFQTVPISHRSCRIQQTWMVPIPKFNETNINIIHPCTALFHRNKDGTLIDVLSHKLGGPEIPLEPPVAKPAPIYARAALEAVAVPVKKSTAYILITSCKRDAEIVQFCLRSIKKYASGFGGVILLVPVQDVKAFRNMPDGVTLTTFDEAPGKGFLHHMVQVCSADIILPQAEHIIHFDSDVMLWRDTTPADFVRDGRCIITREHYDRVAERNENRLLWRKCVERAAGFTPTYDTMVCHANVYPRELYARVRDIVERHVGIPFAEYVLSCENGWPQGFCEYVLLGNVGLRDMPERFEVTDYDHEMDCVELGISGRDHQYVYRPDRNPVVEFWSHAGAGRYKNDAEDILSGKVPRYYLK